MKIGFIGGGNMAEALIKGIRGQETGSRKEIFVSEPNDEKRHHLQQNYKVETLKSNIQLASSCDIIILAIKPQNMEAVIDEISGSVTENKTVVSIAAGIKLDYLSSRLNTKKLVRVMPNTPALVQEGMSVMSLCECFSDKDVAVVREMLMSVGHVIALPEKYMDAVTALSGSGPAFIALFVEAMIEGGKRVGLSEEDATTLAVRTAVGTSKLLDTGLSPSRLRETVTSPGGTTAAGLNVLYDRGLSEAVIAAIESAKTRAEELGKGRS